MNNDMSFLDILTILSFIVGIENLQLNEQQVTNLENHLKQQDEHLSKQDIELLSKIIQQNEEIIDLLKNKEKL